MLKFILPFLRVIFHRPLSLLNHLNRKNLRTLLKAIMSNESPKMILNNLKGKLGLNHLKYDSHLHHQDVGIGPKNKFHEIIIDQISEANMIYPEIPKLNYWFKTRKYSLPDENSELLQIFNTVEEKLLNYSTVNIYLKLSSFEKSKGNGLHFVHASIKNNEKCYSIEKLTISEIVDLIKHLINISQIKKIFVFNSDIILNDLKPILNFPLPFSKLILK